MGEDEAAAVRVLGVEGPLELAEGRGALLVALGVLEVDEALEDLRRDEMMKGLDICGQGLTTCPNCLEDGGCRFYYKIHEKCYAEWSNSGTCSEGWETDLYDFYDTLCVTPKYLTRNKCVDCPPGYTCDGPRITPVGANKKTKKTKKSSVALIVAVCVAAAVVLLAVAFVLRKRSVSKVQHRSESMPSVVEDKAADA